MLPKFICFLAALSLWIATSGQKTATTSKKDFLTANIDTTVSPGEDFFMYANGSWFKRNPIPAEEGKFGIWSLVINDINSRLKKVIEDVIAQNPAQGTTERKIADYWLTAMDTIKIEKEALTPLKQDFKTISRIKTIDQLLDFVAEMHNRGLRTLMFLDYIDRDEKNTDKYVYILHEPILTIGGPPRYLNMDERSIKIKNAFKLYLFKTFRQLGNDSINAAKKSEGFFNLEVRLAKAYTFGGVYNKISFTELSSLTPHINWSRYFHKIGIVKLDSLIMARPKFYASLDTILRTTSLDDWKDFLRFWVVRVSSPFLDNETYNNFFEFNKIFTGQTLTPPRWKRVLELESGAMGNALLKLFVKEYFDENTKKRYIRVIENIRTAFEERIAKLNWMSDSTKQKAIEKLSKMKAKVGYPDKWTDYSSLEIRRDGFLFNTLRVGKWNSSKSILQLSGTIDKSEWIMSSSMRGAEYDGNNNEITIEPGSVVAPGLKDEELDDAFVYGYTFIGHEISHGFDDGGKNFDANGNRVNWWTKNDSIEFSERAKMMIKQYNEFVPLDTLHVNGEWTLSENIADLAGLLICLDAFKKTEQYMKNEKIGGFTPLKRFFLAFAYRQIDHRTPAALANQLERDSHAPDKERVNGILMNIPEFYEAFNIKPGDKMYRPENLRVKIW